MKEQSKMYVRMFLYISVTAVITFITLIDSFTSDQIEAFTNFDWLKLTVKAFIPSLVSLKAYLDNTVHENTRIKIPINLAQPEIVQNNTPEGTVTVTPKRKRLPRAD